MNIHFQNIFLLLNHLYYSVGGGGGLVSVLIKIYIILHLFMFGTPVRYHILGTIFKICYVIANTGVLAISMI
jgi:hypothetical protein